MQLTKPVYQLHGVGPSAVFPDSKVSVFSQRVFESLSDAVEWKSTFTGFLTNPSFVNYVQNENDVEVKVIELTLVSLG